MKYFTYICQEHNINDETVRFANPRRDGKIVKSNGISVKTDEYAFFQTVILKIKRPETVEIIRGIDILQPGKYRKVDISTLHSIQKYKYHICGERVNPRF